MTGQRMLGGGLSFKQRDQHMEKTMGGGAGGHRGKQSQRGEQELLLKPLGAKQRSLVFILKSMGSIEGF